ncbi:MAG: YybH family protein [Candidatus Xenobia bacterium]
MRYVFYASVLMLLATAAWADASQEIPKAMADQAAAWNRGDIDGFMHWYLDSPQTTYTSGGHVVHGFAALRERYVKKYGDSRDTMGQLRFDHLQVTPLGRHHALVLGQWYLTRAGQPDLDGVFTLVWSQTPGGWRIISDHTSLRKD